MKKIVFVTHEYGDFKGHGGIATYLSVLTESILIRDKEIEVFVLSIEHDKKSKLLKCEKFHLIEIPKLSLREQGLFVLEQLKVIKPDVVELTDYLALGLESLAYRLKEKDSILKDTTFVTVHHTASRECFEWNEQVPIRFASSYIQECFSRERSQMKLSDINVAPSTFMNNYVSKNYNLKSVYTILHPLLLERKKVNITEMEMYSLFKSSFVVNCISRIEGRKNQKLLIQQFIKFIDETNADAYLFLIGNSSYNSIAQEDFRYEIYESIPDNYKNRIKFWGFMNEKSKSIMLGVSDVSVLASPFECLSLSMTESVMQDVPVMCSKYCGFSDYIESTYDEMVFDPFKEDDIKETLKKYYYLNKERKLEITSFQSKGLVEGANFENTVDKRLDLYFSIKNKKNETPLNVNQFFIIDERNYMDILPKEFDANNYCGIIVDFYFDKKNALNSLVSIFCQCIHYFSEGEIICFGGERVINHYINALLDRIPFVVIGMPKIKNKINMRVIDLLDGINSSDDVFNLPHGFIKDELVENENKNFEKICRCREDFCKKLISRAFFNENKINLEGLL